MARPYTRLTLSSTFLPCYVSLIAPSITLRWRCPICPIVSLIMSEPMIGALPMRHIEAGNNAAPPVQEAQSPKGNPLFNEFCCCFLWPIYVVVLDHVIQSIKCAIIFITNNLNNSKSFLKIFKTCVVLAEITHSIVARASLTLIT